MSLDLYIRTKYDLKEAVERLGFLPYFTNSISGFSIEEHVAPEAWFGAEPGTWEWKGPVIRETGCAYGKFFEKKAAYISAEWFPDFANFRRDGYDFDARFDDELASYRDKELFDLIDKNAPILSKDLREKGNYVKDGKKGFETLINRLQHQCYVVISDFVYSTDKNGREYGWGVAEYSTPEKLMGAAFTPRVYQRTPEESYERIFDHFRSILPDADEKAIKKFLG
ncbi:MAG: hypothetical protein IJR90_08280 [Clostridia bacterium]|nr:hypothetical protein [Clostridia bacterium]